eukprot:scaffold329293_cov57-Tisochrysis_lutea.AAC.4
MDKMSVHSEPPPSFSFFSPLMTKPKLESFLPLTPRLHPIPWSCPIVYGRHNVHLDGVKAARLPRSDFPTPQPPIPRSCHAEPTFLCRRQSRCFGRTDPDLPNPFLPITHPASALCSRCAEPTLIERRQPGCFGSSYSPLKTELGPVRAGTARAGGARSAPAELQSSARRLSQAAELATSGERERRRKRDERAIAAQRASRHT